MAKPKLDSAGISLFCESVAMMLAAGIQTDEAVGMLSEDIGDVALQATCESVYGRLCAGDTLAVAMKASGAFATDNDNELTLTPKGRYLMVVMMRQFFIGVNNLRDQARAALTGEERELIFG